MEAWALSIGEQRMLRMADTRMVKRADEYILTLVVLALQRNDEAESATVFTHDAFDGAALAEMLHGCIGQEGGD